MVRVNSYGASVAQRGEDARFDEVVARVAAQRGPVAILDAPAAGIDSSSLGPAIGSLLAAPLVDGGRVIGSLHVGTLARREFAEETVELLGLAADRAGLAITRMCRRERDHRIAQELQRSLRPGVLPSVPHVALAARYEPGDHGAAVGGDWYDAIALPGGRVAVAIGDVVGRGVEAAGTMVQMRSALRAMLMEAEDCGETAEHLNRFALGLGECVLTTVVLAVFDPATGALRYTNAGHPPPLLIGADGDGAARYLEDVPAPPVGVMETPDYQQATLRLEPESTLLLYTDGLIERSTEVLDVGLDRLRGAAAGAGAGDDVDLLCERVLGTLAGAQGATVDDVTMLALRALPRREAERPRRLA